MKKIFIVTLLSLIMCVFVGAFSSCLEGNKPQETVDSIRVNKEIGSVDDALAKVEEKKGGKWEYDAQTDEMSDDSIFFASIISDNTEFFSAPYDGGTDSRITVRKHPKYGTDVIVAISQGQLLCSDYNGTDYVTVRFDDAPAKKYRTAEPADYSSDCLFIINKKDFIANAKKAKTIKVQMPVYEEGDVIFTFSTENSLKWEH